MTKRTLLKSLEGFTITKCVIHGDYVEIWGGKKPSRKERLLLQARADYTYDADEMHFQEAIE